MKKDGPLEILQIDWQSHEYGLIASKEVYIAPIESQVEIWINKERKAQILFSRKQKLAFDNFLAIDSVEIQKIYAALKKYASELISDQRITKKSIVGPTAYKLNFRAIIIPKQSRTSKKYVLVLADTNWKIKGSIYDLEIEILIENNKFEFLQEYSGLWTRLDWNYCYNTKEN
ncbi:hypothetical protein IC235_01475 [Hymenobacter sp. BT664]|uniref:Uncharacterized protein n=1 Tax=Hymenobacter montanus TaxID=2771359 RepID=A0A927BAE3_9BACT|nr:hypothetical protein [Hymenobacter montanus]MBD2766559.1 hypothetical protein [Hymenobacter montanus]